MGEVGTILITGAGGYLGRYTVAAARARGAKVRAVVRNVESVPGNWKDDPAITLVVADLNTSGKALSDALQGVDAVIHIAASLTGDDAAHGRDTIAATERLYQVISANPVPVVLASSMAVYQGRPGLINEDSPLEPQPENRDAYARAKLGQERIARGATSQGISTCILRLGAIYGPGRLWNDHIGPRPGPLLIRLAGAGELPLCFAPHGAEALVLAAEKPPTTATGEVLNIIDDDLPDASTYLAAMGRENRPLLTLPLPWQALRPFAWLAGVLRLPAPGLLRPATLSYRMANRHYSNARAKATLGWEPQVRLETALGKGAP